LPAKFEFDGITLLSRQHFAMTPGEKTLKLMNEETTEKVEDPSQQN